MEKDSRIHTCIPSHGVIGDRGLISYNISYLQSLLSGAKFTAAYPTDTFYEQAHVDNPKKGSWSEKNSEK